MDGLYSKSSLHTNTDVTETYIGILQRMKMAKCRIKIPPEILFRFSDGLFDFRRYRLFNNDPRIQRLYGAAIVRTDGAGEFLRLRLVDVVIRLQYQP